MTTWEYKVAPGLSLDRMNELGQDGWEAVGIAADGRVLFKRKCLPGWLQPSGEQLSHP